MKLAVLFPSGVDKEGRPNVDNCNRRIRAAELSRQGVASDILCVGGNRMKVCQRAGSVFTEHCSMARANQVWLALAGGVGADRAHCRDDSMKTTDNVGKDMLGFLKDHYRAIEELHLVSGAMHLARIWWSTVWRLIFSFRPGLWKLLFKIHLHSSGFEERGVWKFGKELFCIVLTIPDPLGIWLWRIPGLFRKRRRLATGR